MSQLNDWTQGFFTGLFAESVGLIPTNTAAEADFLVKQLELKPGERVLDVPCGNGRLTHELAARGFAMTGFDISEQLLDDAQKKPGPEFKQGDMRELPWTNHFDAAFCFGNSFAYFDEDGNERFLKAVHRALKPGGRFALETYFVAESVFMQLQRKRWFEMGDILCLHDTNYDPETGKITSDYILRRGSQVEKKSATYHVYAFRELKRLFEDCGFVDVRMYGSLALEPFRLGSTGLWIVAHT